MPVNSKRYTSALKIIDDTFYSPLEAVANVKATATARFVETIELHVKTNADPRHADQQLRAVVSLPHGTGKPVRVFAFVEVDMASVAKEAGADYILSDEYLRKIEAGWSDFDASIATPQVMPKIAKLGRYLGRKGLMPNPRTGTVVQPDNVAQSIKLAKKGRMELRMDRTAVIHASVGTAAFNEQQLLENLTTVYRVIFSSKPDAVKGDFIKSASICSTMGPGISLNLSAMAALV